MTGFLIAIGCEVGFGVGITTCFGAVFIIWFVSTRSVVFE